MPEPVSRFTVVSSIPVAPGCCLLCRSTVNGPFIDTQLDLKWEREAVFICLACVTDMHNRFVAEGAVEQDQPVVEQTEGIETDDALSAVEAAFDGLRDALLSRVRVIDTGDLYPHGVVDPAPVATNDAGEKQGRTRASRTSRQDDEPVSEQGPDDVPSNSGDQDLGLDL